MKLETSNVSSNQNIENLVSQTTAPKDTEEKKGRKIFERGIHKILQ